MWIQIIGHLLAGCIGLSLGLLGGGGSVLALPILVYVMDIPTKTEKPTLRWMFQCFQGIPLLIQSGKKKVVNLTEERQNILSFFPLSVQNYYILSG